MTTFADSAIPRVARKPHRCVCADDVLSYRVRVIGARKDGTETGWSETSRPTEREAHEYGQSRIGTVTNVNGYTEEPTGWAVRYEVTPRTNPNAASRSPECAGDIKPGDRYVEYLGEAAAYESGHRYCWPCGLQTWGSADTLNA